ncbi:CAP domain-containing protein [Actinomycetes bacterium KLBMP 9797]
MAGPTPHVDDQSPPAQRLPTLSPPMKGRHRQSSRVPGPVGLALLVGVLLLSFGTGAALLRPSVAATGGDRTTNTAAERPDGAGGFGAASVAQAPPSANPTPSASPAGKPAKKPDATPSRTTATKPKRTTTTRPAAGTGTTQSADENEVVEITNRERAEGGCGTVTVNAKLATAARQHSQDQAEHNNMSHTGSDGSSPWDRTERAGYTNAIGENVAMGYRTPAAVMDGWMNSSGHRANILNCDAKAIGVGLAYASDGSPYWTQIFGSVA